MSTGEEEGKEKSIMRNCSNRLSLFSMYIN